MNSETINQNTLDSQKIYTHAQKIILEQELLANLKTHHAELATLLISVSNHAYEDTVYRFYHYSFKVYHHAPQRTGEIVAALRGLAPADTILTPLFEEIYQAGGQEKPFLPEHNQAWGQHTRPFVEAFFHARYFLEMAVKYGEILESAPSYLPSGWAALLCLYGIR